MFYVLQDLLKIDPRGTKLSGYEVRQVLLPYAHGNAGPKLGSPEKRDYVAGMALDTAVARVVLAEARRFATATT